jgi:hypothetical protein
MKYQIPDDVPQRYNGGLGNLFTSQHPNHKVSFQSEGRPHFWTAWCSICESSGLRWDSTYGFPVPDMDPTYKAECDAWAAAEFQEQERKSAERKAKRAARA